LKKLHVRMIDSNDKLTEIVDIDDLERKLGQQYERRIVVVRGKKFMEPGADSLDVVPADEWHEVTEVIT
jgi:hypothetical protein